MTRESRDPYEAALATLKAKEARLVAELDALRNSVSAILTARAAASGSHTTDANQQPPIVDSARPNKFKGMGLGEAAVTVLSEIATEQTAKEIWGAMSAAGFTSTAGKSETAVAWALRKRERKEGDIILVGNGKWGMTRWYDADRLAELRAGREDATTRNHDEHVENTKAGIANALGTRLNHWGRRRTVTAEQMAKAYEAVTRGASKLQATREAGISWPTLNFYWQRFEMENWRPGLPFPPARRAVPKKIRDIKREDIWPTRNILANGHAKQSGPPH